MATDVLVLNRNFYAIEVVDWRRALGLVYLNRAMVVDESWRTHDFGGWIGLSRQMREHPAGFIRTPSLRIAIPEVIALRMFGEVPKREVTFSRRNIYHHYGYRCCYCGKDFPTPELNLDHILPRSRGGHSDWSNVVTSCIRCNMRKGNRLPSEAGMKLVIQPSRPKAMSGAFMKIRLPFPMRHSWQRFIDRAYWDSELEP